MTKDIPYIYEYLAQQNHVLIAGASGSGKSVLINGIIYRLLFNTCNIVLIDPKKVDLRRYRNCQQISGYATEINDIERLLESCIKLMHERYKRMARKDLVKSDEIPTYIIIDEYADLIIQDKKYIEPKIIRLLQLGRAANIHVILATQRPTSDIVNGAIKCNIDCRIALRVPLKQDSRNIIGTNGAETLPPYGNGIMLNNADISMIEIPMISDRDQQTIIEYTKKSLLKRVFK